MTCNAESVNQMVRDVLAFHIKFGLTPPSAPQFLDADTALFRMGFLQEELDEYVVAVAEGDLAKQCDALIDLMYVAIGTMLLHGFPIDETWNEVQRCNMSKMRAGTSADSKRKSTLDVVKPPGWMPPNIEGILERCITAQSGVT